MRVIPVESVARERDPIGEGLPRLNVELGNVTPVHGRRRLDPVPVNGRRLRQIVGEVHQKEIADLGPDRRAGDLVVVGPDRGVHARRVLPGAHGGAQVHLDDVGVGVQVRRVGRVEPLGLDGTGEKQDEEREREAHRDGIRGGLAGWRGRLLERSSFPALFEMDPEPQLFHGGSILGPLTGNSRATLERVPGPGSHGARSGQKTIPRPRYSE